MEPRAQAFAGRAAELRTLEQALAAARAGRGAAILVTGDAGIGKTRLADELLAHARGREIHPVQPRVFVQGETARIVLPGEPGYEND